MRRGEAVVSGHWAAEAAYRDSRDIFTYVPQN